MDRENLSLTLSVLGKLLYTYPDNVFLNKIKNTELFDEIPYESQSAEFVKGRELLAEWQTSDGMYGELISDYQDLFVGVKDKVKTPAWESVYVSPDPVMFGESTLNVRLWYDKYGLEIKNIRHEPDDHMGIELIFWGHLVRTEPDEADRFFTKHISLWYERFFSSMAANAITSFYKGLALILYGICSDISRDISAKP